MHLTLYNIAVCSVATTGVINAGLLPSNRPCDRTIVVVSKVSVSLRTTDNGLMVWPPRERVLSGC